MLKFTIPEMARFLEQVFPQVAGQFAIDQMDEALLVMRLHHDERHLRPGGTVSGPSMFALADVAAYVATMARIGPEALTVTTHCSIDFMRKPAAGVDILAHARVLKLGRTLSVTDESRTAIQRGRTMSIISSRTSEPARLRFSP